MRWRGHTSAADEWLRAEELLHCPEKVAEYDAAAPRRRRAGRGVGPADGAAAPDGGHALPSVAAVPLVAPAGFRLAAPGEVRTGRALVGRSILYRWPPHGWVRGRVVRASRAAGFSHVVRYARGSALGSVEAASLLDTPSHGPAGRWVLLSRARLGWPLALAGRPSWVGRLGRPAGPRERETFYHNECVSKDRDQSRVGKRGSLLS